MVFNPCNCSVAHYVTIVKRILAKKVRKDSLVSKAPVSGIERTLCVDPQHSCPKYLQEIGKDCLVIFLEHRGAYT